MLQTHYKNAYICTAHASHFTNDIMHRHRLALQFLSSGTPLCVHTSAASCGSFFIPIFWHCITWGMSGCWSELSTNHEVEVPIIYSKVNFFFFTKSRNNVLQQVLPSCLLNATWRKLCCVGSFSATGPIEHAKSIVNRISWLDITNVCLQNMI